MFMPPRIALPTLAMFVMLVLAPGLYLLFSPLLDPAFGWRDMTQAWSMDERRLALMGNSLGVAGGTATASLLLGLPLAIGLARTDLRWRRWWLLMMLTPLLIPSHVHAIAWRYFNLIDGLFGSILVMTLALFPFAVFLCLAGLAAVDPRMEEAGMPSADNAKVFRHVTLPLLIPHLLAAWVLVFVLAVTNYGVPAILGLNTYPVEIFAQFSAFYDRNAAMVQVMPLVLVLMALLLLQKRVMGSRPYVTLGGFYHHKGLYWHLQKWQWVVQVGLGLLFGLALLVPISALFLMAGGIQAFGQAWANSLDTILFSVTLAGAVSLSCVALAFPCAYWLARSDGWRRMLFDPLFLMPIAIPATVVGIGIIQLWNQPATAIIYSSLLILVITQIALFVPYVIRILLADIERIPIALEESALLVSPGWWNRMRRIVLPLSRSGLATSLIFVFILSGSELGASLMVMPPGWETLSLRVYNLLHYGAHEVVAVLSLTMIAICALPILLWMLLYKRAT